MKFITQDANVIHRAAFHGEPLPKGYRVAVVPKITRGLIGHWGDSSHGTGSIGHCVRKRKRVYLARAAFGCDRGYWEQPGTGWLGVLLHEFIHARCPGLKHGREFQRLVQAAYERVWRGR